MPISRSNTYVGEEVSNHGKQDNQLTYASVQSTAACLNTFTPPHNYATIPDDFPPQLAQRAEKAAYNRLARQTATSRVKTVTTTATGACLTPSADRCYATGSRPDQTSGSFTENSKNTRKVPVPSLFESSFSSAGSAQTLDEFLPRDVAASASSFEQPNGACTKVALYDNYRLEAKAETVNFRGDAKFEVASAHQLEFDNFKREEMTVPQLRQRAWTEPDNDYLVPEVDQWLPSEWSSSNDYLVPSEAGSVQLRRPTLSSPDDYCTSTKEDSCGAGISPLLRKPKYNPTNESRV